MARILVVDDEPDTRWLLAKVLRDQGFEVVAAADGQAALEQITSEPPDVVLLDLRMLGFDGIQVLEQAKAIAPQVPVIMLTAYGDLSSAVQAIRLGAYDYLTKSFDNEEIVLAVRRALERQALLAREQTARRLETLLLLSQSLTSTLHLETVFDLIVEAAINLVEAEAVGLWVIQEDFGEPALRASAGAAEVLARSSATLARVEELVGKVARGKGGSPRAEMVAPFGTFVGVPLRKEGRVLGVLGVIGRVTCPFTEADHDLLDSFARQAALALENARLYETATQAIETLKESQERIVQLERLRALGEMASGVAHDFNNILTAILGRAQLLRPRLEDPLLRRGVEVIERMALDGARTVRRIQEFARIRRGQAFETVALNELVNDIIDATSPRWKAQAEAEGIRYEVVRELGEIPTVAGDPAELREALMNLVFNALDAMPQGGTLRIHTAVAEGGVTVIIADTGCGMSEEVRRRALEPFFTTKGVQNSGLGLSVTYGILRRHGGDIGIESREGHGTTFTIRLPVGKGGTVEREAEAPPTPTKRAVILVIDDEEEVRTVLTDILTAQGHSVKMAASGKEGLDLFRAEHHDLVLTDLGMPEMSGWQVTRAVKELSGETPVILITGLGEELNPDAVGEGAIDFLLSKPFRVNDVLTLVARALEPLQAPR